MPPQRDSILFFLKETNGINQKRISLPDRISFLTCANVNILSESKNLFSLLLCIIKN